LKLRLEYLPEGKDLRSMEVSLTTREENLEVPLTEIYDHVNQFFKENGDLNSEVILTNNGRYCSKLHDEGFDR
jgi:hypothetical protein